MSQPPEGYLHTLVLSQARGALRCAEGATRRPARTSTPSPPDANGLRIRHLHVVSWRASERSRSALAATASMRPPDWPSSNWSSPGAWALRAGLPALRVRSGTAGAGPAGELLAETGRCRPGTDGGPDRRCRPARVEARAPPRSATASSDQPIPTPPMQQQRARLPNLLEMLIPVLCRTQALRAPNDGGMMAESWVPSGTVGDER